MCRNCCLVHLIVPSDDKTRAGGITGDVTCTFIFPTSLAAAQAEVCFPWFVPPHASFIFST